MNIPKEVTVKLCEAERFVMGLKQLRDECGVDTVENNAYGITKISFKDGSSIPGMRMFMNAGYVDEQQYRETYKNLLK